jgi:glycosyltransferase involved in cell wall biosynthesis
MENKIPTVSILMSVHNGEKYLEQTLQSITSQTYTDFEVIIINDCSTDQTSNILGKYKDNEKFKIINNESCLGLTKSLNIGISKARGKYIARLDADDIALPERLSIQKQFLDDNKDIVCIGSASIIIDENGNKTGFKKVVSNIDTLKFRMILANQISHPSAFFRTEIIKKIGGYNENYKYAQDFNLWSRLLKAGYKISNIEKPLILYRVHNKSISQGSKQSEAYNCAIKIIRENISNYINITDIDWQIFFTATHKHTVKTYKDLKVSYNILNNIKKSYFEKEQPSPSGTLEINAYIKWEKKRILGLYIRNKLGVIYKIKKLIYK